MLIGDLVKISLRQIVRNWRRYRGAMVGTSLGIAGLITVMTIGDSVEDLLGTNLEILGSATIVKVGWHKRTAVTWHRGQYFQEDVDALRKLPGVTDVAPTVWGHAAKIVRHRRKRNRVRLGGVDPSFFKVIYLPVTKGRKFTWADMKSKSQVCIIGRKIHQALFTAGENALGKTILVRGLGFRVIGILGKAENPEYLDTVLFPLSVARAKLRGMHSIRDIYVRAADWDTVPKLYRGVNRVLKRNQPGYAQSIRVTYYKDRIKAIQTIAFVFKFFLYSAIGVTLFLGGLGITNIMLAVVKERTTEIGLRKAVGATERMIVSQFICESLSVSIIGAVSGIVVGVISVYVLKDLLRTNPAYDVFLFSVLAAFVIGVLLGVISGAIPAVTAGKLDPVEAMRFE
jgi:putative ABC transport system permease protein